VDRRGVDASPSRLVQLSRAALRARAAEARVVDAYNRAFTGPGAAAALDRLAAEAARWPRGRLVIVVFPLLHALDGDYPFQPAHDAIAAAAARAGVEVLDLLPALRGRPPADLWASAHDHHPNARAHAIAADAMLAWIGARPLEHPGPLPALPFAGAADIDTTWLAAAADLRPFDLPPPLRWQVVRDAWRATAFALEPAL
jgi:hypothetical protein